MLPNHAPLVIAEQFGTLASLFPGRIDLGLGRAPGTDQMTAHALRRNLDGNIDAFPRDVMELMAYLDDAEKANKRDEADPGPGYDAFASGSQDNLFASIGGWAPEIECYDQRWRPVDDLAARCRDERGALERMARECVRFLEVR